MYVFLFHAALYQCEKISAAETKDTFIDRLYQDIKLYIEEHIPLILNHAIILAQSQDMIRKYNNGKNGGWIRGRGRVGHSTSGYDRQTSQGNGNRNH